MNNVHQTHKLFFKAITEKKLNELLKRADSTTNVLENDINSLIYPLKCISKVTNNCDIIVTFYDKEIKNNKEIRHLSLHLTTDNKGYTGKSKQNGRLHIKNKVNNSCYPLRCTKRAIQNKNNSIFINVVKGNFIRPKLEICSDAIIDILNKYFDFNSNLSLDKQLTNYNKAIHHCYSSIISQFSKIRSHSIKQTYKKSKSTSYRSTTI